MNAVWVLGDSFPVLLRKHVAAKRRPNPERTFIVALFLANHYRDRRGYVDDTAGQVAEVLGELIGGGARSVAKSLQALEQIGVWRRVGGGNRHGAARRAPGPLLEQVLASAVDRALYTGSSERGSDPLRARWDGLESAVRTPSERGQARTSTSPPVHQSTNDFTLSRHISSRVPVVGVEDDLNEEGEEEAGPRFPGPLQGWINNFGRLEDHEP